MKVIIDTNFFVSRIFVQAFLCISITFSQLCGMEQTPFSFKGDIGLGIMIHFFSSAQTSQELLEMIQTMQEVRFSSHLCSISLTKRRCIRALGQARFVSDFDNTKSKNDRIWEILHKHDNAALQARLEERRDWNNKDFKRESFRLACENNDINSAMIIFFAGDGRDISLDDKEGQRSDCLLHCGIKHTLLFEILSTNHLSPVFTIINWAMKANHVQSVVLARNEDGGALLHAIVPNLNANTKAEYIKLIDLIIACIEQSKLSFIEFFDTKEKFIFLRQTIKQKIKSRIGTLSELMIDDIKDLRAARVAQDKIVSFEQGIEQYRKDQASLQEVLEYLKLIEDTHLPEEKRLGLAKEDSEGDAGDNQDESFDLIDLGDNPNRISDTAMSPLFKFFLRL